MKLNLLFTLFFMLIFSACNVAQKAPVNTESDQTTNDPSNSAPQLEKQKIYFLTTGRNETESTSATQIYIKRIGSNLPSNQKVIIENIGSAEISDLTAVNPVTYDNGTPVSILSVSPLRFEVEFKNGDRTSLFRININDDNTFEDDERFIFQIKEDTEQNFNVGETSSFIYQITNNDPIPTAQFATSVLASNEGTAINSILNLSNPSEKIVSIHLQASGNASSADHNFVNQIITFPVGVTSQTLSVNLNDDVYSERPEKLKLSIDNIENALLGTITSQEITINDTDPTPSIQFNSATGTLAENGSLIISATLTGIIEQDITVPVTIEGTSTATEYKDYSIAKKSFTFLKNNGATQVANIQLNSVDDTIFESNEVINLSMANHEFATIGAQSTTAITITENEATPNIEFANTSYLTQEGSTFFLPIKTNTAFGASVSVNYTVNSPANGATPGVDFTLPGTGSFTIPAGSTLEMIPVPILNDSAFDNNEVLDITLTGVSVPAGYTANVGTNSNLVATIKESGTMPIIQFENGQKSVTEGALLETRLSLSKPSSYNLDIDLSFEHKSTQTTDFGSYSAISGCTVSNQTVTILAGQTLCRLQLGTVSDNLDENQEQFIVKMNQPNQMVIGAISSQNITLIDNDTPSTVSVTAVSTALNEGQSTSLNFTLDRVSGKDVKVEYTLSGTATANGTDHDLITLKHPTTGADTSKNTITISAGQLSASLPLTAIIDNDFDANTVETMILTIDPSSESIPLYSIGTASTTVNITDIDTTPSLSITSLPTGGSMRTLTVNEGDIVSIPVELTSTTHQDITFRYTVNNFYAAGNLCNSKCATFGAANNDTNLAQTADITIPKGSKKAIISFQVTNDNMYEGALDERFMITLTDPSASTAYSINTTNTANILELRIKDINTAPKARFLDKTREKVEGSGTVHVPVVLTNASDTDVILLVNVKQTDDAAFKKPDLNDFRIKIRGGTVTTTTDPTSDLDSSVTNAPDSAQTPGWHRPLTYNNFTGVMAQTVLRIPAGEKRGYVSIEPLKDSVLNGVDLYEGTEQAILDLAVPLGSGFIVDDNFKSLKLNILDSDATPIVKFDTVPSPVQVEGNPANNAAVFTQSPGGITYGLSTYSILATPLPQNTNITFDVNFTGTMSYTPTVTSPNDFMEFDYTISLANMNTSITGAIAANKISFDVPAGGPTNRIDFITAINRDYKYEQDETLTATIANIQNAGSSNLLTSTTTYTNDDTAPFVKFTTNPVGPTFTVAETENEQSILVELESADGNFKGKYITQVETTLNYTIARTDRSSGTVTNHTGTIPLQTGGNYSRTLAIDPSLIGDFRKYSQIVFTPTFTTHAIERPATTSTRTWNFTVEDLKVGVSKYSPSETAGGLKFKGHTCTVYRGLVNCFGGNDSGQLGRGNQLDWGGNGQIIEHKSNTIDLGVDKFNNPNYVKEIALGERHTCALFNDNKVRCWGDNSFGQLGIGNTTDIGDNSGEMGSALTAINFGSTARTILSLKSMRNTTCVLTELTATPATKEILCWGDNSRYQVGIENNTDVRIGDHISDIGDAYLKAIVPTDIRLFETGGDHACVITNSNMMYCWGDNTYGQLGLNSTVNPFGTNVNGIQSLSVPLNNIPQISEISMGVNHTCVRDSASTYNTRCWGDNSFGQLGLGRITKMGGINSDQYTYASTTGGNRIDTIGIADGTRAQALINTGNHGSNPISGFPHSKDQFSQVYYPATSITAGMGYTCGVYSQRMDMLNPGNIVTPPLQAFTNRNNEKYIRCWGSNSATESPNYTDSSARVDIGVLSNIGANYDFVSSWNGITLIPFTKTQTDQVPMSTLTTSCLDAAGNETGNTACAFINRMRDIGDSSNSATANGYIDNAFTQSLTDVASVETVTPLDTYSEGWATNFLGSGQHVNFEMNYYYSMHRQDLRSFNDIKLYGGAHHACAVIRDNAPSSTTHASKLLCWGANFAGQAGVDLTVHDSLPSGANYTTVIGGSRSKGLGEGTIKNFSYSF